MDVLRSNLKHWTAAATMAPAAPTLASAAAGPPGAAGDAPTAVSVASGAALATVSAADAASHSTFAAPPPPPAALVSPGGPGGGGEEGAQRGGAAAPAVGGLSLVPEAPPPARVDGGGTGPPAAVDAATRPLAAAAVLSSCDPGAAPPPLQAPTTLDTDGSTLVSGRVTFGGAVRVGIPTLSSSRSGSCSGPEEVTAVRSFRLGAGGARSTAPTVDAHAVLPPPSPSAGGRGQQQPFGGVLPGAVPTASSQNLLASLASQQAAAVQVA